MAKPPMPSVSVSAESPMSGLASPGPYPGKNRPTAGPTGAVYHRSPVPATRIPNSTPLRDITVTSDEFGTSAASRHSLAAAIERLSAKWRPACSTSTTTR